MTILIALHIILVALNGICAGIWFGQGRTGWGFLYILLMFIWGFLLYLDLAA